jgi:hypothetical protein
MWIKDLNTINNGGLTGWSSALAIITQLNISGEYSDWYLPTVNELQSLVNYGERSPAAWLNLNTQGFVNVRAASYWSSTSYAPLSNLAWHVNFNYGSVRALNKSNSLYVWPVRRVR